MQFPYNAAHDCPYHGSMLARDNFSQGTITNYTFFITALPKSYLWVMSAPLPEWPAIYLLVLPYNRRRWPCPCLLYQAGETSRCASAMLPLSHSHSPICMLLIYLYMPYNSKIWPIYLYQANTTIYHTALCHIWYFLHIYVISMRPEKALNPVPGRWFAVVQGSGYCFVHWSIWFVLYDVWLLAI